ncbi:MAG: cupin domain-containing protein [Gemmatimonadota bacterium]
MSHKHVRDIPAQTVKAGTGAQMQVLIGSDQGPHFAMRRFVMDPGGGMPLHTNAVEHEQYVLGGRGRVTIGDQVVEVTRDDVLYIPAGVPHSYDSLGPEPFEFICVVPNQPDRIELVEPAC